MNPEYPFVVINPVAGGGRTSRNLDTIRHLLDAAFGGEATIFVTRRPGDALVAAREAYLLGFREFIVAGGDGTIHECIQGIYALPGTAEDPATMGLISTGTGCGLARSLGIPQGDLKAQFEIALSRSFRDVDLGRIVAGDGRMWFFVSECQIGIGAEVVRHTQSARKAFGGVLAYAIATVPLLFTYPNPRMELECDDLSSRSLRITGISIGNCSITGGGMRLTPHAVPDDGALDVLVIKGQSPFQRLRAFLKVRSGRHIESPAFEYFRVRSLRMKSPDRVGLAADGELLGQPSVYIDVIPQALRVHCPGYHQEEESHEHTRSEIAEIGV